MAQPFDGEGKSQTEERTRRERPPPVVVPPYKMLRASDEASSNVLPRHLGTLSLCCATCFCRASLPRAGATKERSVEKSIVLRKGVSALFAFVKHRLPFVRASQLHGVKPQHPMVALWTRLVYGCSLLLDVVVVPFVPYFRPVWVARFDVKFVQKAGGVRGRRLNRLNRRNVLLLPRTTGAPEHSLGRVRQRATRARNRRRRRAQVHRASTPRARRRHQNFLL